MCLLIVVSNTHNLLDNIGQGWWKRLFRYILITCCRKPLTSRSFSYLFFLPILIISNVLLGLYTQYSAAIYFLGNAAVIVIPPPIAAEISLQAGYSLPCDRGYFCFVSVFLVVQDQRRRRTH